MDQVDNIIFQNFISLGWEVDENVKSFKDLEVSTIATLMIKCLKAINVENELPQSLPHNMSQRFRAAAKIAEAIKELGFPGDLGYQSILYSSETNLRNIFTFLIEKLPKDAPILTKGPLEKIELIEREASRRTNESLQRPWVPPHCLSVLRKYKTPSNKELYIPLIQYGTSHTRFFETDWNLSDKLNHQSDLEFCLEKSQSSLDDIETYYCSSEKFFPTLLNWHFELLGDSETSSVPTNSTNSIQFLGQVTSKNCISKRLMRNDLTNLFQNYHSVQKNTSEEIYLNTENENSSSSRMTAKKELKAKEEHREEEISNLRFLLSNGQDEVLKIVKECRAKEEAILALEKEVNDYEDKLIEEEKKIVLLKKTSSLLSDPEGNMKKLEDSLKSNKEKEIKLLKQWLDFKTPLEKELEDSKLNLENKRSKQTEIKNEISELKRTTAALLEDAKTKELLLFQLKEQKNKISKGANRAVYTKQILDISSKVQKQKQEVKKILSDTRVIQKEINTLTGKLQRIFAVVEDASYKAANSNELARPIYRSVVAIHDEFQALVDITRETGIIQREIADLQQQVLFFSFLVNLYSSHYLARLKLYTKMFSFQFRHTNTM
ncbi:Coiled-coil domain-containing protein 22-like protein [Armadillidium nasatum]|uniref:Coiled-coil domain-containing protein 22 homolog n=1 Tax=Armadillidium nasatum TaxID=96803 RepID=A0A5N5TMX6_9CRUS|nr:Coiled-coil domain-containing protein 22-like protein [Armadillidium nasatum]